MKREQLGAGEFLVEYETTNAAGEWETRSEVVPTGCMKKTRKLGETAFVLRHKGEYPVKIKNIIF